MNRRDELRICLMLVCGAPGAGKTTFCKNFKQFLLTRTSSSHQHIRMFLLSYDEILKRELEIELIGSNSNAQWKQSRAFIQRLTEQLLIYLKQERSKVQCFEEFLQKNLNESSTPLEQKLQKNLIQSVKLDIDEWRHNCAQKDSQIGSKIFVMLDDNFYYESMRLPFYKMCLANGCAYFCHVFRAEQIQTLFERNSNRTKEKQVDHSIIENIHSKLELPSGTAWEKDYSLAHYVEDSMKFADQTQFESDLAFISSKNDQFMALIDELREREQRVELSRQANRTSLIHECDLILRKLLSEKMATCVGRVESKNKSNEAGRLNSLRLNILNELRESEDLFNELNQAIGADLASNPQTKSELLKKKLELKFN
jgi:tRNA uridine 5-carbamoylmethylation protein Kti12